MTHLAPVSGSEAQHPREAAFFSWIRRLGIPRLRGWLGGVCAGIAARIGVDPLIVRGLFVVAAVLGLPALLVYAIAWALLPGTDGRIPLQQLGRGRFDPALIAIAIVALVGMLPLSSWLWATGPGWFGGAGYGPFVWVNGFVAVLLIGGVIALVVWLAARARKNSRGVHAPRTASADAAAPGSTQPVSDPYALYRQAADDDPETRRVESSVDELVGSAAVDGGRLEAAPDEAPVEPTVAADAPDDELARWRAAHAQWRTEHDAWRRRQAEADAAAREQARLEREASARAFAAEAAERRRIRRATNPRASAVLVLAVLGAALVAGAVTALAVGEAPLGASAGLLVAGLVSAVGMIAAGAARRRSGVLAFVTALLVTAGAMTGLTASVSSVQWGNVMIASLSTEEREYLQPFGETRIEVFETGFDVAPVILRKGEGETTIVVHPGTTVQLHATLGDGVVDFVRLDGPQSGEALPVTSGRIAPQPGSDGTRYAGRFASPGSDPDRMTTVPVRIDQRSGSVHVVIETLED